MSPEVAYLAGIALGLALGVPSGYLLRAVFRPVDRWLDVHWGR